MEGKLDAFTRELAEARSKDQAEAEAATAGGSINTSEPHDAESETAVIITD